MNDQLEKIGDCFVDSGTIMIGDPCYVLPDAKANDSGLDYSSLLDLWRQSDFKANLITTLNVLVIQTPYGDGIYPVYAAKKANKIVRVVIDFEEGGY